jgi:uncharacterized protein YaaQ
VNDSSTGGFLRQTNALPLNDAALDAVLQQLVVGVTGLPGSLVRPRWQRPDTDPNTPPTQPAVNVDWCSIGILNQIPHDFPYEYHTGDGDGYDTQVTWETLDVMASFYGPNCRNNAAVLRSGLYINQNRESLISYGIKLREAGTMTLVPDLVNVQWLSRCDLTIILDREIIRVYPILNLESVQGGISTDSETPLLSNKIIVTNPMPV